ncbi:MAG: hypothetical protein AB1Z21_02755 [Synechococcaceae cyanobacterium]
MAPAPAALPALGLGSWKAASGEVGTAGHSALQLGYRHIDCAAIHGNEAEIRCSAAERSGAGGAAA